MEEKEKYEYVLRVSYLGGFEILEHKLYPRPHEFDAAVVFYVNDWSMGDGDGHPACYDETLHKKIPESVYDEVMRIFHDTGKKMVEFADNAEDLDRDMQAGDYLYHGGSFYYIEDISNLTGKYWIKNFYYDSWALSCEDDTEIYQSQEEWFKELDIESTEEFKVITKEIYDKAFNVAKSGVLEVKGYLKRILISQS